MTALNTETIEREAASILDADARRDAEINQAAVERHANDPTIGYVNGIAGTAREAEALQRLHADAMDCSPRAYKPIGPPQVESPAPSLAGLDNESMLRAGVLDQVGILRPLLKAQYIAWKASASKPDAIARRAFDAVHEAIDGVLTDSMMTSGCLPDAITIDVTAAKSSVSWSEEVQVQAQLRDGLYDRCVLCEMVGTPVEREGRMLATYRIEESD